MKTWVKKSLVRGFKLTIMIWISFIPLIIFQHYFENNIMDSMHEFNLFFTAVGLMMIIMWAFSKIYNMPIKPEPPLLKSSFRNKMLDIIEWSKNHDCISMSLFFLIFFMFFIPINHLWVLLCQKGFINSNFQAVIILYIGISILMVPISIMESFYTGIIHPKKASFKDIEKILKSLYSKKERTKDIIEYASKKYVVEPYNTISKLSMLMGVVAVLFLQLAGYSVNKPNLMKIFIFVGSIFGLGMILLIIISNIFGQKRSILEVFLDF